VPSRLAEFLAEDAVAGEARLDPSARGLLGLAVGPRHRRAVGLQLHVERPAEVPVRFRARQGRDLGHGLEQRPAHLVPRAFASRFVAA
jgi:hypothetical protein